MSNKTQLISLLVLALNLSVIYGQNYVNSPYTRYGIGDLQNTGFAYNKALGGVTTGIRPHNQINYLNPASFTAQDTNSFIIQSGMTMRFNTLKTSATNETRSNMNLDYVVIGFPLGKFMNASIGMVPYSRVEYHFFQDGLPNDNDVLNQEYDGRGGLNEFYLGISGEIANMVSIGASFNYLFGSFERLRATYVNDISENSAVVSFSENYIANDAFFRAGIQFHPTILKKHKPVLGVAYELETDISSKADIFYTHGYKNIDTDFIEYKDDSAFTLTIPQKISVGLGYTFDDKYMGTIEFATQDWAGYEGTDKYTSLRAGFAYRPISITARARGGYFEHVEYRIGAHYTNTYLKLAGKDIIDRGISIGVGLPWKNYRKVFTGTAFNFSYQFSLRGESTGSLVKEQYHKLSVGVTLHDFWFFKPKYD